MWPSSSKSRARFAGRRFPDRPRGRELGGARLVPLSPNLALPMSETQPSPRPVTAGRAVGLFVLYTVVFAIGGGLAAGIMAFVFEAVSSEGYDPAVYAITFGVTGFIAYRLAQRVAEG